MPKVSIIVPVYNKENYVADMIASLKMQTFQDFEVILINDGSTDQSGRIIEQLINKDKRFCLYNVKNGGVSSARNIGLSLVSGEWIQFLDADDQIDPIYLEKAYAKAVQTKADIVFSDFKMVDSKGNLVKRVESGYADCCNQDTLCNRFIELQYLNGFFGFISNKLFSRNLQQIAQTEFPLDIKLAEDLDFYVQLYRYVEKAAFLPVCSFDYLQTDENYLHNDDIDYRSQLRIQMDIKKWYKDVSLYERFAQVLDQKISQYAYYTLFHENEKGIAVSDTVDYLLREKLIIDSLTVENMTGFQKMIIKALKEENKIKIIRLFGYRTKIRKLYRMLKNG